MTLYLVFGIWVEEGRELKYFYGAFSTEEKAKKIIENLENAESWMPLYETLEIEKYEIDTPSDLYDFMIS